MFILSLVILVFLVSITDVIADETKEFYKDPKFWLSLGSLTLLSSIATYYYVS